MKTLIMLILLGGAFLGGYHFGHQPGSPDVTAWVQNTYHQALSMKNQLDDLTKVGNAIQTALPAPAGQPASPSQGVVPTGSQRTVVGVDGKTYCFGGDSQPQLVRK